MTERPRTGAYALIVRDGQVLLVQQTRGPFVGRWNVPGGAIERGEQIDEALMRECAEEIGVAIHSDGLLTIVESHAVQDGRMRHVIGLVYRATLRDEPRLTPNNDDVAAVRWWPIAALHDDLLGPVARGALEAAGLWPPIERRIVDGCYTCANNLRSPADVPIRERIYDDGLWRVAHAFSSALPGWLVVLPHRHIESIAELTAAEADALGSVLRRVSAALLDVTGCVKTYVALFAEAEGFHHLHVHVVPRMADQPADRRGPGVFGYLSGDRSTWISEPEMNAISAAIADRLARDSAAR